MKQAADATAMMLVEELAELGKVSSRKMFGGYGIFESGKMFALVTSDGTACFKVNEESHPRYEQANAQKFGKMPYYSIPDEVLAEPEKLLEWARQACELSKG